jgi:predicted phage-related endonuclease
MINNARKRLVTAGADSGTGGASSWAAETLLLELFMKSRENLVRLKQFQVNEKRRQLAQLETMIAEFERMAAELEAQIAAEERKAGITDIQHFAYPTFAKAARLRRDNLKNSQLDLAEQKSAAAAVLAEAEAELIKAELLESRDSKLRDGDQRNAMIG